MIFIIEFYSTVVEFCRKLLTLYDNGKREKAGGGWIKCKSLPRFEGILHFIESLQFILVWLCCLSKSFWIYHNNQLLWIIQTHLKLPLNPRSWIKANFTVLFLLISSDMLDLFIIPRKKNMNFGQLYIREFRFVLQHSWKRLACCFRVWNTIYQTLNKLENIYVVHPI